jgi:hypothetical protein
MGEVKSKKKVDEFSLPEKKITVRLIRRAKGLAATVGEDHIISGGMIEGASRRFCVPKLRNGGLKNVLTKEEKEWFESNKFFGVNLSIYSEFWKDFAVKLYKHDKILDLSDAEDYLQYKVLLAWDKVIAPSLKAMTENNRATYQYVLIEENEEVQVRGEELGLTKKAWKLYAKYEDNRDVLTSILSLMSNKKVSDSASMKFLRAQVENLVDTRTKDFVNLVEDSDFEIKQLIALAEVAGIIVKKSGKYETVDGLTLAEKGEIATLQNAVKYLNNPRNQEVIDLIRARLANTKE